MHLYSLANKRVDFMMHDPNLNPLPSLAWSAPEDGCSKHDLRCSHRSSHQKATLSKPAAFEFPHRWQNHQRGKRRSRFRGVAPVLIPSHRHRTWQQTRATSLPPAVTSAAHLVEDLIAATLEPPRPAAHLE